MIRIQPVQQFAALDFPFAVAPVTVIGGNKAGPDGAVYRIESLAPNIPQVDSNSVDPDGEIV